VISIPPESRRLFGTDGIRGQANVHPMTPELVLRLGKAIAWVARNSVTRGSLDGSPRIVIGKDTRLSGYMLETALASGICAMGGSVLLTGPIPTPAVANLTHSMRAHAGVVISASHNPYEDNGIKLFGPDGYKLADEAELEIERLLSGDELDRHVATVDAIGKAERIQEASGRYIVYAKNTFPKDLNLRGLKIVVDAAHGAAYRVAPCVFEELGATVVAVGCAPNGQNINLDCGALHPEHVARMVVEHKADLGVALDGDADRLIVVDERGQIVDGDALMALCATRLLATNKLVKKTVVATVMSNMGLEIALKRYGGVLKRTAVGDRYVVEEMRAHGYNFGGEQSGHLVFADHATTGDGVVAALQVLAVLVREGKRLSELAKVMTRLPQTLHNIKLPKRLPLDALPTVLSVQQAVDKRLGDEGRSLIRWSGTENVLRIMLEGPDQAQLEQMAGELTRAAQHDCC
jgi:phosphoglucosamine mutase